MPISITPRTTSPAGSGITYYNTVSAGGINTAIQGNGAISGADVLNNCVGYSQGRMLEMLDEITGLPVTINPFSAFNVDAENWYQTAVNNGFNVGTTPQIGAVGVWHSAAQAIGHVANIEAYNNGIWEISESHYYYPGGSGSWDYSYLQSNLLPAFIGSDPTWSLIGFIYPFGAQPVPMQFKKMPFIYYLRRRF